MSTTKLKPARLFEIFEEICQVPRPSKHEEKISAFLADYGRRHGLETKVDAVGNVAISGTTAVAWWNTTRNRTPEKA